MKKRTEEELIEYILERLSEEAQKKDIMNLQEFCNYTGLAKSTAYKLTSSGKICYYRPNGGKIFFHREDVENWVLNNRSLSIVDREAQASNYIMLNPFNKIKKGA